MSRGKWIGLVVVVAVAGGIAGSVMLLSDLQIAEGL